MSLLLAQGGGSIGVLTGTASAVAGQAGALNGAGFLTGAASALAGQTGTAKGVGAMTGAASALAGQTGTVLVGVAGLSGVAEGNGTASGLAKGAGTLSDTAAATFGQSGNLSGLIYITGTASLTSAANGNVVDAPRGYIEERDFMLRFLRERGYQRNA